MLSAIIRTNISNSAYSNAHAHIHVVSNICNLTFPSHLTVCRDGWGSYNRDGKQSGAQNLPYWYFEVHVSRKLVQVFLLSKSYCCTRQLQVRTISAVLKDIGTSRTSTHTRHLHTLHVLIMWCVAHLYKAQTPFFQVAVCRETSQSWLYYARELYSLS